MVCVPAGTLHAILGGLVIAEIQQNSNTTYRVYDWNRVGADGKPRPLHVEKALDVINFDQVEPTLPTFGPARPWHGARAVTLCRNSAFVTERIMLSAGQRLAAATTPASLEIWSLLEGQVRLGGGGHEETLQGVQFALLPAALGDYALVSETDAVLLRTTLPESTERPT
jgi:mannose-6-phosphate isomerase